MRPALRLDRGDVEDLDPRSDGSIRAVLHTTCQSSSTFRRVASVVYDHSCSPSGQVQAISAVAVSPDSLASPTSTVGVSSPIPSTVLP